MFSFYNSVCQGMTTANTIEARYNGISSPAIIVVLRANVECSPYNAIVLHVFVVCGRLNGIVA